MSKESDAFFTVIQLGEEDAAAVSAERDAITTRMIASLDTSLGLRNTPNSSKLQESVREIIGMTYDMGFTDGMKFALKEGDEGEQGKEATPSTGQ